MEILGIDIGGTGVKGAIIDTNKGEMVSQKIKYGTPEPKDPKAIFSVIHKLCDDFEWTSGIGLGFPSVILDGHSLTANNVHSQWVNYPIVQAASETLGRPVSCVNDADAAGLAETRFGAGRDHHGTVLMLTLGTGVGSALFINGHLVPNIELGNLHFKGGIAEKQVSNHARKSLDLSWKTWGRELNEYFQLVYQHIHPDVVILGGGVSKEYERYAEYLSLPCPIVPATMRNGAGIVGAALHYRDVASS